MVYKVPTGYPLYKVFPNGTIIGVRGKILKPEVTNRGYLRVALCYKGKVKRFSVHRLVATLFVSNPLNKVTVNHKDGVKINNVSSNLEWATQKISCIN